jgi:hypothetical protein
MVPVDIYWGKVFDVWKDIPDGPVSFDDIMPLTHQFFREWLTAYCAGKFELHGCETVNDPGSNFTVMFELYTDAMMVKFHFG